MCYAPSRVRIVQTVQPKSIRKTEEGEAVCIRIQAAESLRMEESLARHGFYPPLQYLA